MSDSNYREQSKRHWRRGDGQNPTLEQLQFGAIQRIADATELMAKRHSELVAEAERHKNNSDYWERRHDHMARRLIAARGQITKLKKQIAAKDPSQ